MKKSHVQWWYAMLCFLVLFAGSGFHSIKVTAANPEVTGITLNKTELTLTVGTDPVQLTATVTPATANQEVRWTSSSPLVASVDSHGIIKPLSAGTSTIIATTVSGGKTALASVTVKPIPKSVTGITLDKSTLTLPLGKSGVTLTAQILPTDATNKKVNWVSSNTNIVRVDANGQLTPVAVGKATIVATTEDGGFTATCLVNVTTIAVNNISLDKTKLTLGSYESSVTLKATIFPSDATNKKVNWSSSNTSVATVNASGTVTPRNAGKAMITATTEDGNKKAAAEITVVSVVRNVFIDWESDSKIFVTWEGTSGSVKVELRRGTRIVDTDTTSSRKATFSALQRNTDYQLYIDGEYIKTINLYDMINRSVRDLNINKESSDEVTIDWNGTSGTVRVELVEDSRIEVSASTSRRSVTFDDLDDDSKYKIYIAGKYAGSFIIENLNQDFRNVVIDKQSDGSAVVSWSGTQGSVEVMLYADNKLFDRKTTSTRKVTFTKLHPTQEYEVYIDGLYAKSFKLMESPFKDLRNHWAQEAIERLAFYEIINGFPNGTFQPNQTVTKEQFVTMLVRAKDYTIQRGSTGFRDVSTRDWSAPFIYTAIKQGVIKPGEYGLYFDPKAVATREEMAVMVARAQKLNANSSVLRFKDNRQIENKGLVGATVKEKIIVGYPDNTFRPNDSLTRAEAAMVIDRIFEP